MIIVQCAVCYSVFGSPRRLCLRCGSKLVAGGASATSYLESARNHKGEPARLAATEYIRARASRLYRKAKSEITEKTAFRLARSRAPRWVKDLLAEAAAR